jgi:PQ loop repeat protein
MSHELMATLLGMLAAALTSLSYIPQARKALPRGATRDLSLKMLAALFWPCSMGRLRSDSNRLHHRYSQYNGGSSGRRRSGL